MAWPDAWVNARTGEIAELAVRPGPRYPQGVKFSTMFADGWEYLAGVEPGLAPTESKVLFKLLAKLDYENWIVVSQQTLAEDLHLRRPHVTRAVSRLVDLGILEVDRDPSDRRRSMYRLNAALGWKGSADSWARHIAARSGSNVIPMPGRRLPDESRPPES